MSTQISLLLFPKRACCQSFRVVGCLYVLQISDLVVADIVSYLWPQAQNYYNYSAKNMGICGVLV